MHCSINLVRFRGNLLHSSLPEMKSIFPNRRQISTSLHGVTFKNTVILTPIKISNLTEEEHNMLITTARGLWLFYFQVILIVYHLQGFLCSCVPRRTLWWKIIDVSEGPAAFCRNDWDKYSTKRRFITRRCDFRSFLEGAGFPEM
jgi:hypothetical protein